MSISELESGSLSFTRTTGTGQILDETNIYRDAARQQVCKPQLYIRPSPATSKKLLKIKLTNVFVESKV
jgi:hypothetical protein